MTVAGRLEVGDKGEISYLVVQSDASLVTL